MKRLILMFLVGVSIIFFGCSKDNSLAPSLDQNDQAIASLKSAKVKTAFTGICTPISLSPVNTWYDATDDWRVTGTSIWYTNEVLQIDDVTFEVKGTCELTVDDNLGKWSMEWHGTQTLTSPDGSTFKLVGHAVGIGIKGKVKGLTARWKYTMDFDGTPETFFYVIKGKITEEI